MNAVRALIDLTRTNLAETNRTLAMSRIDLAKRYSGATLGYFWAVVKPALFVAVYWFAISVGLRGSRPMGDIPYIYWLVPGIVPWFFMSDALTVAGSSIRNNRGLVTKMVFPVETIPVFTVLSLYYVHLALIAFVALMFAVGGFGLSVYALQLPYFAACTLALALAFSIPLSTLTVLSRDIEHMIRSTVQVVFWMTPIIWPLGSLDGVWRYVMMANPVCYLVEGYRAAFVYESWFWDRWEWALYFWGFVTFVALVGAWLFKRTKADFADVL